MAEMGGASSLTWAMVCVTTSEEVAFVPAVVVVTGTAEPDRRVAMELRRRRCLSNMSFLGLCGLGTCTVCGLGTSTPPWTGDDAPEGGLEGVWPGRFDLEEGVFFLSPPPDLCLKVISERKSSSDEYEKFKMSSLSSRGVRLVGGELELSPSPSSEGEGLGMEMQ